MSGEAGLLGLKGASDWRQRESDRWLKTTDALGLEITTSGNWQKARRGHNRQKKLTQDGGQKQASWRRQLTVVDGVTVQSQLKNTTHLLS